MSWRTGRQLGRTLYRDEQLVGMVDTPEIAQAIVQAMNGQTYIAALRAENEKLHRGAVEALKERNAALDELARREAEK